MNDVGIVTGCHKGDVHFVRGTLASIRYFMPDIPICLIADGNVDTKDIERRYHTEVIRIRDLPRTISNTLTGTSKTKFAAFFYGPFQHFLWLDSDAIVWGDFRNCVDISQSNWTICEEWNPETADVCWETARTWVNHYFFDINLMEQADPSFDWRNRTYSSAGCFAAEKTIITEDDFWKIEELNRRHPGLFKFWDQGMLHYMMFKAQDEGRWTVQRFPLQLIPSAVGSNLASARLLEGTNFETCDVKHPHIVHFCGAKPFVCNRKALSWPMTRFRFIHYTGSNRSVWKCITAIMAIAIEEIRCLTKRIRSRLARLANTYRGPKMEKRTS